MRNAVTALALCAIAVPLTANPFGYVTALVPINPGTVPGAFGAQWTTTLWAANNSDSDIRIGCQLINENCQMLKAHSTSAVALPYSDLTHQGFFLSVPYFLIPQSVPANGVAFDLRVSDSVTAPHSAGTEVPLARPDDFSPVVLLPSVPINDHSRVKLRVYGLGNGSANVRVNGAGSNQEFLKTTLTLTGSDASIGFGRFPSYAEIDLPTVAAEDSARVEIDGMSDLAVWAMITVTDNVSQQFTVVAPQQLQYISLSVASGVH